LSKSMCRIRQDHVGWAEFFEAHQCQSIHSVGLEDSAHPTRAPLRNHARSLSACCLLLFSLPVCAQAPLYKVEMDQVERDGRVRDRLFVARQPDQQGKEKLFVTVQFKVIHPDGQPALDIDPADIVVKEDGRVVKELEIHSPAAAEVLT